MNSSKPKGKVLQPTQQEIAWAVAIKQAARQDTNIDATVVSDWEFLQHAIVAKGSVLKSLQRLQRLQALKQRYGIIGDGSIAAFERDWKTFRRWYPGFLASVYQINDANQVDYGAHVWCQNLRYAVNPSTVEEAYAVRCRILFYVLQASHGNLPAMRAGFYLFLNCDAVTWRNLNMEQDRRNKDLWGGKAYPVRLRRVYIWNLPVWARIFYYMVAILILSPKIRKRIIMCSGMDHLWQVRCRLENEGDHWLTEHLAASWGGKVPDHDITETFFCQVGGTIRQRPILCITVV